MTMDLLKRLDQNVSGRDFVVGDIHGCYSTLEGLLGDVAFDKTADRLFSLGDLVDRGPESERAFDFIASSWFHPIRGNHDQMMVDAQDSELWERDWLYNGGLWSTSFHDEEVVLWADAMASLPFAIEVATSEGPVGLVHAGIGGSSWNQMKVALSRLQGKDKAKELHSEKEELVAHLIWSRVLANSILDNVIHGSYQVTVTLSGGPEIEGLRKLFIGHTVCGASPVSCGNVTMMDTGAGYPGGVLSMANINTGEVVSSRT